VATVVDVTVEVEVDVDVDVFVSDLLSEPQPTRERLSATAMVAVVKYFFNCVSRKRAGTCVAGS